MGYRLIAFLATCFVGLTAFNRIMEGALINATDVAILNNLSLMKKATVGLWTVPVPNRDVFDGLFQLGKWDYSFFSGNAQYIQFFLYSLSFAVMIVLLLTLIGGISQTILRAR